MDDASLPLTPLHPLLPLDRPFTRAMARTAGIGRPTFDRMLREGRARRLLRGVYAASLAPDTVAMRAAAVGLVIGRESIAVDRTAGWVHGVDVTGLDRVSRGRSRCSARTVEPAGRRVAADSSAGRTSSGSRVCG